MSPYCRRCGRDLADEPRFCPECGYEQDTPAAPQEIGDTVREATRRLADRAINVSGQHKDLLCQRCEAVTEHVSVSWAELADEAPISDSSTFVKNSLRALGRVCFSPARTNPQLCRLSRGCCSGLRSSFLSCVAHKVCVGRYATQDKLSPQD